MVGQVAGPPALDLVLYAHWAHVRLPIGARLAVYAVIAVGSWLWFGAVIREQFLMRRKP
jgi:type IV secretory pathway VirB2 component (pilin)